jgi:hypothetical protein
LNRSSGALVAGDAHWYQQQVNALNSYTATMRALVTTQPGLLQALRNALVAAGLPPFTIDVPTMTQIQGNIGINGLPPNLAVILSSLGQGSADIEVARTMLATHPQPGPFSIAVQAQTFPDLLVDPALLNALAAVAASDGTPPPAPPPDTEINVAPTTILAGGTVTVNWGVISSPSALDWFGLFPEWAGRPARAGA